MITQIKEIAKNVKTLKIITRRKNTFSYLEDKLYIDYGIAIQITNNKEKALLNSDIIINYDLNEEKLIEYSFPLSGTIVNIKSKANPSNFKCQVINNYKIDYNKEIIESLDNKEDFDTNVLYESLIFKKDTFSHIKKQLNLDEVILKELF